MVKRTYPKRSRKPTYRYRFPSSKLYSKFYRLISYALVVLEVGFDLERRLTICASREGNKRSWDLEPFCKRSKSIERVGVWI